MIFWTWQTKEVTKLTRPALDVGVPGVARQAVAPGVVEGVLAPGVDAASFEPAGVDAVALVANLSGSAVVVVVALGPDLHHPALAVGPDDRARGTVARDGDGAEPVVGHHALLVWLAWVHGPAGVFALLVDARHFRLALAVAVSM